MDSLSAFVLGAALNLLFNITAGLVNRNVAIRITRWGWLYFFLHATYLIASMNPIKPAALFFRARFGASTIVSYIIVAMIGVALSMIYWGAINKAYWKLFQSQETANAESAPTSPDGEAARLPTPQHATTEGASSNEGQRTNKPQQRRRSPPPDDGADILLGKKRPKIH